MSVHLRDIMVLLFPGNADVRKDKKFLKRQTGAYNLALNILRDHWEGTFEQDNPNEFGRYMSVECLAAIGRGINGRFSVPPGGKHEQIDQKIRRLHKAGLSEKILQAVRNEYPDVAKAMKLDTCTIQAIEDIQKTESNSNSTENGEERNPPPKKRGRKGLSSKDIILYRDVVAAWDKAHDAGVKKKAFVPDWNEQNKGKEITLELLGKALTYRRRHRK